jgi:hypothetical protein
VGAAEVYLHSFSTLALESAVVNVFDPPKKKAAVPFEAE